MAIGRTPTGSGASFETLIKELNHKVWEVRREACEDLGLMREKKAVPQLLRLLTDSVGAVRYAAAEALGKIGDKNSIGPLIKEMDNPHFGSPGPLVDALGNLKAIQAVPSFINLLRNEDARLRTLAANALMVTTRQVIPFKAKASEPEREEAIRQWEHWWQNNGPALLAKQQEQLQNQQP